MKPEQEWITDVAHESKEFRGFIDYCFTHFRNQMDVMLAAYVETDEGRKDYEKWLMSFEHDEMMYGGQ